MNKYYEYALVSEEDEDVILAPWNKDYAEIRVQQRQFQKANMKVKMSTREVSVTNRGTGNTEPMWDVDKLVGELTPVLAKAGIISSEILDNPETTYNEVERIALTLMPLFAESVANAIVVQAIELYATTDEDAEVVITSYEEKKDKMFDQASHVRSIGGVEGWSHSAGRGQNNV